MKTTLRYTPVLENHTLEDCEKEIRDLAQRVGAVVDITYIKEDLDSPTEIEVEVDSTFYDVFHHELLCR